MLRCFYGGEDHKQEAKKIIKDFISQSLANQKSELRERIRGIIPYGCEDDCYPGKAVYCERYKTRQILEKVLDLLTP